MTPEVQRIFRKLEQTASWYGIQVKAVNQKNDLGDTPLHTVCSWGEVPPVELLIEAGADVNARGDRGCTPVFNAVVGESADVIRALKRFGASLEIKSVDGRSVLEYARNVGSSREVLEALAPR